MTTARMKGNKGPNGEKQPPLPFDLRPGRNGAEWGNPLEASAAPSVPRKQVRPRWRSAILPVVAFGGISAMVAAAIIGYAGSKSDTSTATPPDASGGQAAVFETPTPDARATEGAAVAIAVANGSTATSTSTVRPATVAATVTLPTTSILVPPTATATPSGLVRSRYVVAPGDSCESIRGKFNVPFSEADDFYTALGKLTGKTAASQCSFFPGDVVCVPSLADLVQPSALSRDVACLTTTS